MDPSHGYHQPRWFHHTRSNFGHPWREKIFIPGTAKQSKQVDNKSKGKGKISLGISNSSSNSRSLPHPPDPARVHSFFTQEAKLFEDRCQRLTREILVPGGNTEMEVRRTGGTVWFGFKFITFNALLSPGSFFVGLFASHYSTKKPPRSLSG